MIDYQASPPAPAKKSGSSILMLIVSGVLVVALVVVGVLYAMEVGKLNKANDNIASLEDNVSSLQSQLATEQANVADLQSQLDTEKANVADLQSQLTSTKADLSASQDQVTSLTSDLADANAKVTSLTSDLADANAQVASTQADLDQANADLAIALANNDAQTAELSKVKDPRFFNSLTELNAWLAQDDTNTNPAYAPYSSMTKAYILQIKALRDGYLIGAYAFSMGYPSYYDNTTIAGGVYVEIDVLTDQVFTGSSSPAPLHPLPLSAS